jgi:hypothetical protein
MQQGRGCLSLCLNSHRPVCGTFARRQSEELDISCHFQVGVDVVGVKLHVAPPLKVGAEQEMVQARSGGICAALQRITNWQIRHRAGRDANWRDELRQSPFESLSFGLVWDS